MLDSAPPQQPLSAALLERKEALRKQMDSVPSHGGYSPSSAASPAAQAPPEHSPPINGRTNSSDPRIAEFRSRLAQKKAAVLQSFLPDQPTVAAADTTPRSLTSRTHSVSPRSFHSRSPKSERSPRKAFSPEINEYSASLLQHRQGDIPVFERLHSLGLQSQQRLEQARQSEEQRMPQRRPHINRQSEELRRDGTVEDILLRRNDEYKARREELSRLREEQELAQLRAPCINKVPKEIAREPFLQRLADYQRATNARKESLRRQLEEQKLAEVRRSPEINPISKHLERNPDVLLAWAQEAQRRRKERQDAEVRESELTFRPQLYKKSIEIARRLRRAGRVEEHLLRQAEEAKRKREERARQQQLSEAVSAVPQISVHSANLSRQGDIAERLYAESQRRQRELHELQLKHEAQLRAGRDPVTGQRLYSPFINRRSAELVRGRPVEEVLVAKGEELEQRRLFMAAHQKMAEAASGAPRLGAYSQLLVELQEKRTNMTARDRLLQPIHQVRQSTVFELASEECDQYTFRPTIDENSRAIDEIVNAGSQDPEHRRALLLRRQHEYEERRALAHLQRDRQELAECTFAPWRRANRRSISMLRDEPDDGAAAPASAGRELRRSHSTPRSTRASTSHDDRDISFGAATPASRPDTARSGRSTGGDSMYARSAEWQRKLWERREAERLQRERKELQEAKTPTPARHTSLRGHEPINGGSVAPPTGYSTRLSAGIPSSSTATSAAHPTTVLNDSPALSLSTEGTVFVADTLSPPAVTSVRGQVERRHRLRPALSPSTPATSSSPLQRDVPAPAPPPLSATSLPQPSPAPQPAVPQPQLAQTSQPTTTGASELAYAAPPASLASAQQPTQPRRQTVQPPAPPKPAAPPSQPAVPLQESESGEGDGWAPEQEREAAAEGESPSRIDGQQPLSAGGVSLGEATGGVVASDDEEEVVV